MINDFKYESVYVYDVCVRERKYLCVKKNIFYKIKPLICMLTVRDCFNLFLKLIQPLHTEWLIFVILEHKQTSVDYYLQYFCLFRLLINYEG